MEGTNCVQSIINAFLTASLSLDKEVYFNKIISQLKNVKESSSFINCRFEDILYTAEGALVSSGSNELCVKITEFVNCSSKKKCGGIKKSDGTLIMECCIFIECHGEGGNDNILGTAMGSSMSNVDIEDVTFYFCWKQALPYADNVYGLYKGKAVVERVNCSHSISRTGALTGCFYENKEGASIKYLQSINGEENNALEIWNKKQTVCYINVLNNSFTNNFFYASKVKMTVTNGCFFYNNCYIDYGTVEAVDCVSDKYSKAKTNTPFSTANFFVKVCIESSRFSLRTKPKLSILFLLWIVLTH